MAYRCKSDDEWVIYLLNNEGCIRRRLDLFLMTERESSGEFLGVTSSKTGRENENMWIDKITNKNYMFRKRCLECLERVFDELPPLDQDIWTMRFRQKYSCERVGREVNYGKTTVYDRIKAIKDRLLAEILVIEEEVFNRD